MFVCVCLFSLCVACLCGCPCFGVTCDLRQAVILFYFLPRALGPACRARGISAEVARQMLVYSFGREVVQVGAELMGPDSGHGLLACGCGHSAGLRRAACAAPCGDEMCCCPPCSCRRHWLRTNRLSLLLPQGLRDDALQGRVEAAVRDTLSAFAPSI